MGRRVRNNLPMLVMRLETRADNFKRNFSIEKKEYKYYYDFHTRPSSDLSHGTPVCV